MAFSGAGQQFESDTSSLDLDAVHRTLLRVTVQEEGGAQVRLSEMIGWKEDLWRLPPRAQAVASQVLKDLLGPGWSYIWSLDRQGTEWVLVSSGDGDESVDLLCSSLEHDVLGDGCELRLVAWRC
ncbi:MAG: hypothetical protein MUE65_06260 [Methanomassiliicoccales archaeon]|nr:hypothetical protein [Methanomassiliicoccales archaeon]